jgi:quercetin dioxygenase-like cupin family protein
MIKPTDGMGKSDKSAPAKTLKGKQVKATMYPINNKELEHEKAKSFIIVEIIEYVPNSVVIKTIIKKTTGNVTVSSFDTGEALTEKTSPFDTFIQVIDGKAEIVIDGNLNLLDIGESIIIPAHSRNVIKANERFKIISTIIKSDYDEVI